MTQVGVIRVKLSARGRGACRRRPRCFFRLHFGSTEITVTARDPISGRSLVRLQFTPHAAARPAAEKGKCWTDGVVQRNEKTALSGAVHTLQ